MTTLSGTNTEIDTWENFAKLLAGGSGIQDFGKDDVEESKKEESKKEESKKEESKKEEPKKKEPKKEESKKEESEKDSEEDSKKKDSEEESEKDSGNGGGSGDDDSSKDEESEKESEKDSEEESEEGSEDEESEKDSEEESEEGSEEESEEESEDEESDDDLFDAGASEGDNGSNGSPGSSVVAEDLLEQLESPNPPLLDNNSALEAALSGAVQDLQKGEKPWKPASTEFDTVNIPSIRGESGLKAKAVAQALRESVRGEVSTLTSKMRTKFLQARTPQELHGVPRGRGLSERRLVETFVEIKAGRLPTRPDWRPVDKDDVSLACAIVLDQSGSMQSLVLEVGKAAIAVAEPLSNLGSPCLVIGPRNGGAGYNRSVYVPYTPGCHRNTPVIIDMFKDWDEKISQCADRFGKVQATGSTPLEDGIQYALKEISKRKERHRVILVVTDGVPDHADVVKGQIRIAAEAGIPIIGVGISSGCYAVKGLFPQHVQVPKISELPHKLLRILDEIIFPSKSKKVLL